MISQTAYCHRCRRTTATVLIPLRPDLVGHCCQVCRACRKGRPFASKRDVTAFNQSLMPLRAHGVHRETSPRV